MSGNPLRMSDRSPGPILQAQPALWTVSVNRTRFSSVIFPPDNLKYGFSSEASLIFSIEDGIFQTVFNAADDRSSFAGRRF
jgi:hypothetical protein